MADQQIVVKPQEGKQSFAVNVDCDVIIYGGSAGGGKSRALLMRALRYMHDPHFYGTFFRRTKEALVKGGSLWPEAKKLYREFGGEPREQAKEIVFPSGATIKFDGLQQVGDEVSNYQGAQITMVAFDETTHFEQEQFLYLLGRLRSESSVEPFAFLSCNPDPDSWLLEWVRWWLDDDGYADDDKQGIIRYFLIKDEQPILADTAEELIELYPELCQTINPVTGETVETPPKSITFISATIFDNPALLRVNPGYLASLQAQSEVNRARLLYGNWLAREEGSTAFHRSWLKKVQECPPETTWCRAYDKAAREPSEDNRFPDYTACIKMGKCPDGNFYIAGDFHKEFIDSKDKIKDKEVYGRFRKSAGERDRIIKLQAEKDGTDCVVVFAKDPGAAGLSEYENSSKALIPHGFVVKPDPMPNNKSKFKRYEPFSSACENGFVYILEHTFPNKQTLEHFYKENEAFNGEPSTSARKDDIPDVCASGFNFIASKQIIPTFTLPPLGSTDTRVAELKRITN